MTLKFTEKLLLISIATLGVLAVLYLYERWLVMKVLEGMV